jgi:desulfoferrodoxin (superoxide reductase-like protein)
MGKKIFLALLLSALWLQAHPPKAVELNYDAATATLSVKVLHHVSDPEKHYVKNISVFAGKELLAKKNYERQETADVQEEIFLFMDKPLRRGSVVTVTAACSIMGETSAELKWK